MREEDPETGDADATVSLLNQTIAGIGRLVSGEIRLARAEAAESVRRASSGFIRVVLAAVLGLVALVELANAAALGLVAAGLSPAIAALAIGGALAAVAIILLLSVRAILQPKALFPRRTVRGVQRDAEAILTGLRNEEVSHG